MTLRSVPQTINMEKAALDDDDEILLLSADVTQLSGKGENNDKKLPPIRKEAASTMQQYKRNSGVTFYTSSNDSMVKDTKKGREGAQTPLNIQTRN